LTRIIVGITGAIGTIFGIRLLEDPSQIDNIESHLILMHGARLGMANETEHNVQNVEVLAHVVHSPDNLAACISSGYFKTEGMIVTPCSMKSLSMIAYSIDGIFWYERRT
jgi:flavin prenyltransferase